MTPLRQQFIDSLKSRGLSERTIQSYVADVNGLTIHCRCNPLAVTRQQVQDYLLFLRREKHYAPATINQIIGALKTFFNIMAPGNKVMDDCPRMKVPHQLPLVLSREEVDRLIAAIKNLKQRAVVMLLYSAGLRLSEVISLRPMHIESSRMKVRVENGKGSRDRYTILSEKTLHTLREYFLAFRPKQWLFEGWGAKQYGRRTIGKIITVAAARAGLNKKVTPHTLRHTFATHLMEAGVALPVIQKLLGHSSIKTTMIYLHVTEPMIDRVRSPFDDVITTGVKHG